MARHPEAALKIAIIAWGSLVWDPRDLKTAATFAPNGPLLPVEFCRISADGRLTLAIDETVGAICTTYSAESTHDDLDAAIENLRAREGTNARDVGFAEPAASRESDTAMDRHPQAVATIGAWAPANGYDAAVWTALESNFERRSKDGEAFSVTAAIRYLEALQADDAAKFEIALAYIRKAPPEIQTPVRDEVAKRWPG
jgi:hypothetical protein